MNANTQAILADLAATEQRRILHDRTTPSPRHHGLTIAEAAFSDHMSRWGSDGYPVRKVGSRWIWDDFCGVSGAPTVYKTKRECVAAIGRYIDILHDKLAGRL
mgnify:CR=1 FL=1